MEVITMKQHTLKSCLAALLAATSLFCAACSNIPAPAETTAAAAPSEAVTEAPDPEITEAPKPEAVKDELKELEKYVFEVAEYTELDYDYADRYFTEHNDNWGGGCSAISKLVDGHRLVGRNMDLNISNKCAYIIRTNAGKYRTLGLAYTFRDLSPDYDVVVKDGISQEFYNVLPFMCDDVLNDSGLHVEINMRHGEYWPNGEDKFACAGTNPDSNQRVYMFELPRYIGENCATVAEAKEYVASLDVYSQNHYWNYCFLISDAVGNSSLLEFSSNEVHWLDEADIPSFTWLESYGTKAIGQTNLYLNEAAWAIQDIKSGEGRFISLQAGIDAVSSRSDMYDLMRQVQYSSFYLDYDDCKENHFDPRSENIGEIAYATYDFMMNPEHETRLRAAMTAYASEIRTLSRQELQDANMYWESSFTEVVDTNEKAIFVRMFENEQMLYLITFDGTVKLDSIADWA